MLDELLTKSKEEMEKYIHSLTDFDKATLLTEIEAKKKESEDEFIRLETMKSKLEEDEANQMKKLNTMGIASYEDLDTEINKLESELDKEILKYMEALKGE